MPENDFQQLKAKRGKIQNPRLNPYVPFVPGDPIQQAQLQAAEGRHNISRNAKDKSKANKLQDRLQNNRVSQQKTESTESGLQYEKLEDGDKRFGQVIMSARSRKEREKKGIILLEGRRLILDSIQAGAQLKYLYFSDLSLVASLPQELLKDAALYKVQYKHLKIWADTHTPAGILGVFAKPDEGEVLLPKENTLPLMLICDNVRDPGNMGTLIRTAAAAGCGKILATKGCVDVWDPKVLRGAMGAHFYTAILNNLTWENVANHLPQYTHVCIADTRKDTIVQCSFDVSHPEVLNLLTVGRDDLDASSESDTDDEQTSLSDSDGDSDSDSDTEAKAGVKATSRKGSSRYEINPLVHVGTVVGNEVTEQTLKLSKEKKKLYESLPMSVVDYSEVDYSQADSVAVVIGGETEGVSAVARKFAFDRYGQFVTIPMAKAVDSLNTGTAAAIILYEIRRQLVARLRKSKQNESTDV